MRRPASTITVTVIVVTCLYPTATFLVDYVRAISGAPDAQWQFSFVLVPVPVVLGAAALVVAYHSRPPAPRFLTAGALAVTLLPVALAALVIVHAY